MDPKLSKTRAIIGALLEVMQEIHCDKNLELHRLLVPDCGVCAIMRQGDRILEETK